MGNNNYKAFMKQLEIDKNTPYINIIKKEENYQFQYGIVEDLRNNKDFIMTKGYSLLW